MVVVVRTRCPECGKFQNAILSARKRCVYCGHRFLLFPKRERARVYEIIEGTYDEYLREMNKIYWRLEKRRERDRTLKKLKRIKEGGV